MTLCSQFRNQTAPFQVAPCLHRGKFKASNRGGSSTCFTGLQKPVRLGNSAFFNRTNTCIFSPKMPCIWHIVPARATIATATIHGQLPTVIYSSTAGNALKKSCIISPGVRSGNSAKLPSNLHQHLAQNQKVFPSSTSLAISWWQVAIIPLPPCGGSALPAWSAFPMLPALQTGRDALPLGNSAH